MNPGRRETGRRKGERESSPSSTSSLLLLLHLHFLLLLLLLLLLIQLLLLLFASSTLLHKVHALQGVLEDGIVDGAEHLLHVFLVNGACRVIVELRIARESFEILATNELHGLLKVLAICEEGRGEEEEEEEGRVEGREKGREGRGGKEGEGRREGRREGGRKAAEGREREGSGEEGGRMWIPSEEILSKYLLRGRFLSLASSKSVLLRKRIHAMPLPTNILVPLRRSSQEEEKEKEEGEGEGGGRGGRGGGGGGEEEEVEEEVEKEEGRYVSCRKSSTDSTMRLVDESSARTMSYSSRAA